MAPSVTRARIARHANVIIAGAVVLGLLLRLGFGLGYWVGKPLTKDQREYLSLARSIAQGNGFAYDAQVGVDEPLGRAPGYPAFLALVGGGGAPTKDVPVLVKVVQSGLGALGVALIGIVTMRLAGPVAGSMAALIAACYPSLVSVSAYALSEALTWPLAFALVWLFDGTRLVERRWVAVVCGALAGAASLVHPTMLIFVALAALWLLWRQSFVVAAVFLIGTCLVIAPWTLRNYRTENRFVLVASEGGMTFWMGNHPLAQGEGDLAANPKIAADRASLRAEYPELTTAQMEPVYYREALNWVRTNPLSWLMLEARKLLYLIVPIGPSYRQHSALYYSASVLSFVILFPVALLGFVRLGATRADQPALWMLVGASVIVALVFFPQERFRIPLIDPVLVVCAGAAFANRSRWEIPLPSPVRVPVNPGSRRTRA